MNDERWRQVDKIFHDVLEQEPHERKPFLDRVCTDDLALKQEIEDLIRSYEEAGNFLDSPASDKSLEPVALKRSTPLTGQIFGRYEMRSLLGSGGMGDVYLARDSELKREVAIKVLPDAFSKDSERVARFRREAEALASLNHPNIAAIYDLETLGQSRCLVLELVKGETLGDVLARGPIQLDEALRLAKQIAEALEAAHEKGIVHRDLKPANIKVTNEGLVKVLDFGLAKMRESEAASRVSAANSADTMATKPGRIMGTAAYMSPEQARGKTVDKRADIWAFGCVFYQMVTGRAPFRRDTNIDTLGAILERDPDWSALPATTPSTIRRLLSRCLDKDVWRRLHDIADARIEIEEVLSGAPNPAETRDNERAPTLVGLRWPIAAPVLIVAFLALGALTWKILTLPVPGPAPLPSLTTIASSGESAFNLDGARSLAIVPNGRGLVYTGTEALWFRQLDQLEPQRLVNFASPLNFIFVNNRWAGYVEGVTLKKVPVPPGRGPAKTIAAINGGSLGATWAPEDMIIFGDNDRSTGLKSVSADGGGKVTELTHPDPANSELDHAWPEMLPDGHSVLFTILAVTGGEQASRLAVFDLRTPHSKPKVLEGVGGSHAHYVPSGHLLYSVGGKLQAIAFDLAGLKILGKPSKVLDRIVTTAQGGAHFDVAADGTLVYVDAELGTSPQERNGSADRSLVWVNRNGGEVSLGAPPDAYGDPRVSPDKRRVAVAVNGKGGGIRIWDLSLRKFSGDLIAGTKGPRGPVWLDRSNIAYFTPGANPSLWRQNVDGGGKAEPLGSGVPYSATKGGKFLLFSPGARDLMRLPLDNPNKVETLLQTSSNERHAVVSPDSRWLAYQSDMDGAGSYEILVAPYSNAGIGRGRIVSSGGGTKPLWNPSSSPGDLELFYLAPNGAIKAIRVGVDGMRMGDATTTIPAASLYLTFTAVSIREFDVSSDGQRFLMIKKSAGDFGPPAQINVRQNWLEELKRLAPVNP